ncbi:P-loop containing nucleoside triphosphate hydrolase protein [Xylaria cf. heliscus]|nr:P-loop containing nucleoside triphosphate hydrolase protein [Xylaria cf. heliscus]
MDKYESIHGKDVSSFDLTSTHRLPTVSAAQALDDLKTSPRQLIHTGLEALDQTLAGVSLEDGDEPRHHRGIQKGQIVEVWGPPASGKTTFAMQIAANTLQDGCSVVWVDTFHPLCHHRLGEIMSSSCSSFETTTATTANFVHYSTPTLAHLIGLLCKPRTSSVPSGTSLIVIDGLSGLINRAFPKNVELRQTRQNAKGSNLAVRRLQVLQYLVSALQKLSATQDLLIVVLSQCATRMQAERSATITPAINASTWEQGIATRLVLFQDWATADAELRNIRLIGVQKNNGQTSPNGIGLVFPFEICNGGLVGLDLETNQPSLALAPNPHRQKRKFGETDMEIADSEGEDYGWEDEDEAEMPNMPPQWQGSEDLLLGRGEEDDNLTVEMSEQEGSCEPELQKHANSP